MTRLKKFLCILFASILPLFAFSGCKDDAVTYQNQFLNTFGIDFVSTKYEKIEQDALKCYISIELNEAETSKMEAFLSSSNLFYRISEKNSDYGLLKEILENNYSEDIISVETGYFSVYNKTPQKIIDLSASDFKNIDMSFFTALIYDAEKHVIYLFDYNVS